MDNVSVVTILVNFFGAEDTSVCIASLMKSTIQTKIVVVDNSPNDPELVDMLQQYPEIKLIQATENLGFGRGNNLGIDWALAHTDCEYIFILNNDANIKENTIECLLNGMDNHPESAVVSPRIVFSETPEILWYGGGEVDWKRGGGKVPGVLGAADASLAMQSRYVSFATGCAMFFRAGILKEQKGFDPRFFMYEEDLELSLRVQESGWKIWYESGALLYHKGQGSTRKKGKSFIPRFAAKNPNLSFLVYEGVKNTLLNMSMHAHAKNRIIFLSFYPMFLGLKCIQWGINGRWNAVCMVIKALKDYRKDK